MVVPVAGIVRMVRIGYTCDNPYNNISIKTMIEALHNINFQDRDSDREFKSIMHLSENLRKKHTGFKIGSDEHLDYISERTKVLDELIVKVAEFNDKFENMFPHDKETGEVLLSALHILHSALSLAVKNLELDNYKNSFSTCLNRLQTENNQLVEYIEDINEFILSDDESNLLDGLD